MQEGHELEKEFTPTPPLATDEELAIMMELKSEQAGLSETMTCYKSCIKSMYNDFAEAYKEDYHLRLENDNLRVEIMETAAKLSFKIPEEDKLLQPKSTQVVEGIENFFLRMLKATDSGKAKPDDFPPDFPCIPPYCDSRPGKGAATSDYANHTADGSSFSPHVMVTAVPNSKDGGHLTSRTLSTMKVSSVSMSAEICGEAALCAVSKLTEQNLVRSFQNWKPGPSSQSSLLCMPNGQPTAKAAITDPNPVEVEASTKLKTRTHMELMAGLQRESSLIDNGVENLSSSGCEIALVQNISSGTFIGGVTTLVVRNIPITFTKEMVLQELPPDGTYNFFYLPFSFKQKKIAGYLFLNFISHAAASAFHSQWHGRPLHAQMCSHKLNICAAEVQGLEENVRHLINCKIKRIKNPRYLPSVFVGPQEVPFREFVEQLQERCKTPSAEQRVQPHNMDDSSPDALALHSESG